MGDMRIVLLGTAALGASLLLLSFPASALDTRLDRASLKGIKNISVVMENLPRDVEEYRLTRSQLQTDVELRLRQAGLTVVDESKEYLYVQVTILKYESGLCSYAVRVQFNRSRSHPAHRSSALR